MSSVVAAVGIGKERHKMSNRAAVRHPTSTREGAFSMTFAAAALTTEGSESLATDTCAIVVPSQDRNIPIDRP